MILTWGVVGTVNGLVIFFFFALMWVTHVRQV